jgi:hypothetical protein
MPKTVSGSSRGWHVLWSDTLHCPSQSLRVVFQTVPQMGAKTL